MPGNDMRSDFGPKDDHIRRGIHNDYCLKRSTNGQWVTQLFRNTDINHSEERFLATCRGGLASHPNIQFRPDALSSNVKHGDGLFAFIARATHPALKKKPNLTSISTPFYVTSRIRPVGRKGDKQDGKEKKGAAGTSDHTGHQGSRLDENDDISDGMAAGCGF